MTEPRENVKWTLTDQALQVKNPRRRKSVCFTNILFMDKYALLLAKVCKVFRFHMGVLENGDAHFWFSNHHGHGVFDFQLPYARAEKLLKLISPGLFDVELGPHDSEFLGLISQTSGNLAFDFYFYNGHKINMLREFWPHLSELRCDIDLLQRVDTAELQERVFERLHVRYIGTDSRLALALKQKAEVLSLDMGYFDTEDLPLSSNVINLSVKECYLEFGSIPESNLAVIQAVANACKNSKLIGVEICYCESYDWFIFDEFLDEIASFYDPFKHLVDFLNGMPFASKLAMSMEIYCSLEFHNDWLDRVTTRIGLQAGQLKAGGEDGEFQVIDERDNVQFKFDVKPA